MKLKPFFQPLGVGREEKEADYAENIESSTFSLTLDSIQSEVARLFNGTVSTTWNHNETEREKKKSAL